MPELAETEISVDLPVQVSVIGKAHRRACFRVVLGEDAKREAKNVPGADQFNPRNVPRVGEDPARGLELGDHGRGNPLLAGAWLQLAGDVADGAAGPVADLDH